MGVIAPLLLKPPTVKWTYPIRKKRLGKRYLYCKRKRLLKGMAGVRLFAKMAALRGAWLRL